MYQSPNPRVVRFMSYKLKNISITPLLISFILLCFVGISSFNPSQLYADTKDTDSLKSTQSNEASSSKTGLTPTNIDPFAKTPQKKNNMIHVLDSKVKLSCLK